MEVEKRIINTKGSIWKHQLLNWIGSHKEFPARLRLFGLMKELFGIDLLLYKTPSGLTLLLDISDWVQSQIYFFGNYEKESLNLFKKLAQNASVIFDAGTHIGQYALECAYDDGTQTKRIFAIEVNPKTFTYLLNNIQLNKFKNVTPVLGAIAANHEILNINIPAYWNMGNTQITQIEDTPGFNNYLVASFSILDILKPNGLKRIDLLKIDIEGNELIVLEDLFTEGIYPTNIILEFIPSAFSQCASLLALLQKNEYILKDVRGDLYDEQKELFEQNLWAQKL